MKRQKWTSVALPALFLCASGSALEASAQSAPPSPKFIAGQVKQMAAESKPTGGSPRSACFEIAYPSNHQDYAALAGNVVVFLSAFAQKPNELPLRRVYVVIEGKQIDLPQIAQTVSDFSAADADSAQSLGKYRQDSLYLMPLKLRMKNGELFAATAANNSDLKFGVLSPMPDMSEGFMSILGEGKGEMALSLPALTEFVNRKYPGFSVHLPGGK